MCDTSGLIAYFDVSDAHHDAVSAAIDGDAGPFVVSPYVLAELDYLLATRRSAKAELSALAELVGGAWDLPALAVSDVRQAVNLIEQYVDLDIGLADASQVVLAGRYGTNRLLTLDQRHFRVVRTISGQPFQLLPWDA